MIIVIGDVHGELHLLNQVLLNAPDDATIIQLGDFGFWPSVVKFYGDPPKIVRPILAIGGNHEFEPWLSHLKEPTEIWPNVTFVPRGTVLEIEGRKIGFLGGGDSIDKDYRTPGFDWFPEERVTKDEAARLLGKHVDVLLTHSPPAIVKETLWGFKSFPSETNIQWIWDKLNRPDLYCGHMHPDTVVRWENATVLPILHPELVK